MSEEIIWVNLVPNENKSADNHPDWVAPPNPNAPEGKKWTIGTKIGETWHNPAGWNAKDDSGNLTGAIKIKLTPNNPSAVPQSGGNKGFAKAPISGNKPEYRF
jgi:hypothetical protein